MDGLLRQTNASKSDGEVVWSCCLDAGIKLRETSFRTTTVTRSPITGESTKETVKTIRAGNAGMFGEPVVTNSCAFLLCT
jgi:hypothetical protein